MERNTIQIQHINLDCPIAEFGFNRFLLTFFIRYRVLNSNAFRPGIGPQPLRFTALFFDHVAGSPNCWTSNRPAWSKIEGRLQISKCWNLLIRTARWVVPQTRVLQRSNTRAIFHNIFIDMCRVRHVSHWPPEPSNAPPTFFSLINWYQTLNCYVCVWGYFSHFTLVQNVLTVCTSLSSMCL